MSYDDLSAKTINLRIVNIDDASFIYSLRTSDVFNKHLSTTSGAIYDQQKWIEKYKAREDKGEEYYFIIERKDNAIPIGTIRMYDFRKNPSSFCWGSWILNENKTASAALESALLIYKFAFNSLNFEQSHFDVRNDNEKVIAFHKKFGAEMIIKNELDSFFIYKKEAFINSEDKFKKYLVAK